MVIRHIVVPLLWAYIACMVVYALMSWFPLEPDSPFHAVQRWLSVIIEPVLRPLRRFIPPVAGLDLSFMLVMLVLIVLVNELEH